jgi:hypothetical protein
LPKGTPRPIVDRVKNPRRRQWTRLQSTRMLEIGVTGTTPDRRSPEYLAKYVVDEVARWEAPIKSGGLQVD